MDEVVVSSSSALRALSGVRACAQLAPPRLLHARRAVPAGLVDALWRDAIVTRHSMPGRAFCGLHAADFRSRRSLAKMDPRRPMYRRAYRPYPSLTHPFF